MVFSLKVENAFKEELEWLFHYGVSGRGKHLVWHHYINAEAKGAGLPAPSHNSTFGTRFLPVDVI